MTNAVIYYFTATGNSFAVARTIAEKTGATLQPITHKIPESAEWTSIGFVYPTFFMGLPGIVEQFVRAIHIIGDPYLFAVTTSGPMPGSSLGHLNRMLAEKGKALHYNAAVRSVANYIAEYNVDLSKVDATIEKARRQTEEIAADIGAQKHIPTRAETFFSKTFYKLYTSRYPTLGRNFTVSGDCTGCGRCQMVCLADNIEMKEKRPVFKGSCESCMACIHWCPTQAIQWKTRTQNRNRYHHPDVSIADLVRVQKNQTAGDL